MYKISLCVIIKLIFMLLALIVTPSIFKIFWAIARIYVIRLIVGINAISWKYSIDILQDILSRRLIILSLFLLIIVYLSQWKTIYLNLIHLFFFYLLTIVLTLTFRTPRLILFYFYFECSLLPIFFLIIMGWGYQPERLGARLAILFYTIFASLPLLITSIFLMFYAGTTNIVRISTLSVCINGRDFFAIFFFSVGIFNQIPNIWCSSLTA